MVASQKKRIQLEIQPLTKMIFSKSFINDKDLLHQSTMTSFPLSSIPIEDTIMMVGELESLLANALVVRNGMDAFSVGPLAISSWAMTINYTLMDSLKKKTAEPSKVFDDLLAKSKISPERVQRLRDASDIVLITSLPAFYRLFKQNLPMANIKVISMEKMLALIGTPEEQAAYTKACYLPAAPAALAAPAPLFHEAHDGMSHICDGLHIGDANDAGNKGVLQAKNISVVVNCTKTLPNHFETESGVHYLRVPIDDLPSQDITPFFESTFAFLDEHLSKGEAVLVHCMAGISRSVTIVIAYLMRKKGLKFQEAFALVRSRRHRADPSLRFSIALLNLEKSLAVSPSE